MDQDRNVRSVEMPPEQVILFIIGTIVILFGAYYVTYFVGMKASGQTRAGLKNRNISVIDRYAIARDKQFCIIEIAGKVYIVGITNHTMTLLDTLDAAAFAKLTEDNEDTTPWNMTPVGQYGNRLTRKVVAFVAEKTGRARQNTGASGETDFAESLKEAQRTTSDTSDTSEESESVQSDGTGTQLQGDTAMQPDDNESKPSENQPENPEED